MNEKTIGLFLGAGFSYELGLPIVNEATAEIRNFLTPQRIVEFNNHWNQRKLGHSAEVIKAFVSLLESKTYNYESMIGALEVYSNRSENSALRRDFHGIKEWFTEIVWTVLSVRQVKNLNYIKNGLEFYRGIKNVYETGPNPLWVFSLNHDLVFEIIAKFYGLGLRSGFPEQIEISRRGTNGEKAGTLLFDYLSSEDLKARRFNYVYKKNEKAINLLKLHGALDLFAKDDKRNFVKLSLDDCTFEQYLDRLEYLLTDMDQLKEVRATNHISYYDDTNVLQFLRKSLLSGAYKFDQRNKQTAPIEYLELFRSNIKRIDELIVIGYSFSDFHIDSVIRDWLTFTSSRKMVIVNPNIERVPNYFVHLSPQISLIQMSTTEYLRDIEGRSGFQLVYHLRKIGRRWVYKKAIKGTRV